ncbi:Lrp/AsnC family transcriptional regulator [Jiangella alkaliphila]|uniref:DNA-binding transcriptional regulator, Lrp family n=1 Tax=Jiangella alkaliphila TaxID=419479 RepID=A0A1H2HDH0_9ACTN|nr:Lrp/AsnC family transcriptional regulator [Jiangella alkaliphila]SDU29779.1 DNA-binding transcriptional regulator, Lrp family [Jiangella alkaliphila]
MKSVKIDELDRLVVAALLANPRATHAVIGQAVRSSEATVSRRLARLRRTGAVRVVGALDSQISHRARSVFVRLRCAPGAADDLALPLAQWLETGSVKVLTGSVDCVAEVAYTSNEHLYALMMHRLPQFDGVMATFSNQVIRRFSTPHGWNPGLLPDTVVAELRAERRDRWSEHPEPDDAAPMSELDEQLVDALIDDGRTSWQDLAARCGVTPSTARRRTEALMAQGVLRMRCVVEPEVLGLTVNAFVWLTINPTKIGIAGEILARHRNVIMIAATTGDRNLCGEIAVASDSALYEFLSETVGHLPGLIHADVAVALRTVKRAGMIAPELRSADLSPSVP